MKRFLTLALVVTMVCALAINVSAADKKKFEAAKGTAVIDGTMDDCYTAATEIILDTISDGTKSGGAVGTSRVCWDDKFIYVFVDIKDTAISIEEKNNGTIWNSDSVEAYFDFVNDGTDSATAEVNAGQWTAGLTYQNPMTWGGGGLHNTNYVNDAGAEYKAVTTDKGWAMEMKVPFGNEYTVKENAEIGFTVAICDDTDGEPSREFQVFPSAGQDSAWSQTGSYDKLVFTAKEFVPVVIQEEIPTAEPAAAPITNAAQTMDMSVIVALSAMVLSGGMLFGLKKKK